MTKDAQHITIALTQLDRFKTVTTTEAVKILNHPKYKYRNLLNRRLEFGGQRNKNGRNIIFPLKNIIELKTKLIDND